jgi:multiple sugar transport system ATP-binding protein
MRGEIKELHQKLKTTAVYVTHDQIEAMTMADRIVVMRDGWIEQIGDPLQLYDKPANLFVAGFIGSPSMNFIPGAVKRAGNAIVTTDGVTLPAAAPADATDGHKVVFGVRPEHFVLSADDSGLPTKVAVVEPTGAETLVIGRVGEHTLQVLFKERRHFAPGDEIRLRPLPGTAHLFDAGDGKRLA